ncbi:hypothetical protein Tco_0971046 [Tanacetum coccineum]
MAAFNVHETQFQTFIKSQMYLDDEYVIMTRKVNERQMQTTDEKVDTSKALDASLVITECSVTNMEKQDTINRLGNDVDADYVDIKPIYDEEPMAEVPMTVDNNVFTTGQQHTEQPEFINEGKVDQDAEQCHDMRLLPTKLTDNQITKLLIKSLESKNTYLKKTVAQFQKDFSKLEAHCINLELELQNNEKGFAIAALKNKLRKLSTNSVNTKFAKQSILGKPVLQPHKNQSVVRQPTAFKSERPRISKPWFASQIDVNNDLSKPVTTYYFPKERESAFAKPHHVITSSNSRNSSKNMPRFSSNDMVHNHYLEEAKNKIYDIGRNSKPSAMSSARSQSTTNDCKP